MASIRELAPAKINLTLNIAGRRADGLHLIESLVAFADVGDAVTLEVGSARRVDVTGPMAGAIAGPNILSRTLALLEEHAPDLKTGPVRLEKHLPVAAGVGGGSADAGALLRAVRRANASASASVDWHGLARALGADVPVCLEARPLWMTGIGESLVEIERELARLDAVLVNPMASVPVDKTARVFRALGAAPASERYRAPAAPSVADRGALLAFMRAQGNALTDAAQTIVPEIGAVLSALRALPEIDYAALSGAGPTCFGIFPTREAAEAAQMRLAAAHPAWWIVAATIG